jgi:Pheophorbide a oxygenase
MNSHRSSAISYQCALRQGLVWVKLKPPIPGFSTADIHIIPELDTVEWVPFGDMHRDVPYDFINLLENVIDPGHVSFTHAGSVSTRDSSGTFDDMGIVSTDAGGFKGKWIKGPRKGKLGSLFTEFKATMMRHTLESKWGFANITAVYGVPTSPGRCRAFVRQPLRLKNNVLPKALLKWLPLWLGHIGANSVLDEDNIFLHHQEVEAVKRGIGNKPVGQVFYLSGSCDAYVIAFRKWLTDMAGGGPFGQQTQQWLDRKEGLRLSKDELLDHYHSHTATCLECQRCLAFMKAVKNGVGIIGLASFVVAVTSWTMQAQGLAQTNNVLQGSAVISVISVVVWQMCVNTVGAFYKGSYPPRRNMVSGEWKP